MSPVISATEVKALRFGVATASLGLLESHTLDQKFQALQDAGIEYCELGFGAYMSWVRARCPNLYVLKTRSESDFTDQPRHAHQSGRKPMSPILPTPRSGTPSMPTPKT